jgi:hypothetical protein
MMNSKTKLAVPQVEWDNGYNDIYLRMLLKGREKSGKTYTALQIAQALSGEEDILPVIDTENRSSLKYKRDFPQMAVINLGNYSAKNYIDAIWLAVEANAKVIIIDGLSPEWDGEGGLLDQVNIAQESDKSLNVWKKPKELHRQLIKTIQTVPAHVICTVRTKTKVVPERDKMTGKTDIKKYPGSVIQDGQLGFEFDIVAVMSNGMLKIEGSRAYTLPEGEIFDKKGNEVALKVKEWLNG